MISSISAYRKFLILVIMVALAGAISLSTGTADQAGPSARDRVADKLSVSVAGDSVSVADSSNEKSQATGPFICDYCKDTIRGQYIEIDGKYYHPIHFLCHECGKPIAHTSFYKKDGHYFCADCYAKLFKERCALCGEPIMDNHVIFEGTHYHDSCFRKVHVCALCGEFIDGPYIEDFWGNKYHAYHRDKAPSCDYCGRFISDELTGGAVEYDDGRLICGLCYASAVSERPAAEKILLETRDRLDRLGIHIVHPEIRLHLVDRHKLAEITRHADNRHMGHTRFTRVEETGRPTSMEFDIYILHGMPRYYFTMIAAHELMHVWQFINAPDSNDASLCEGSCNYASYLVLKTYSAPEIDYLIHNLVNDQDEIYGEGFRRVKKFADDRGLTEWLALLRSSRHFPEGY